MSFTFQEKKDIMVNYLKLKLEEEDWHGVQDAGSDLRDIESKEEGRREAESER